jgi:hypothetical protein
MSQDETARRRGEKPMRGRSLRGAEGYVRGWGRRGASAPLAGYPTPAQILFRIGVAMLIALCVALAANAIASAMGS